MAYGKVGILGFSGTGKTFTGSLIAIGLAKLSNDKRPIGMMDTETGSDWIKPMVNEAGFDLVTLKSRAFTDLTTVIPEAEKECSAFILDSATHVWRDLTESYKKKLNRRKLQFQDWDPIKTEWGRFTDLLVNSKLHFIVCGRAGYEYDTEYDEDGSKDLVKIGTKMKAEGEFGFEPSLIIEMERVTPAAEAIKQIREANISIEQKHRKRQGVAPKVGSAWIHRAHIMKDRSNRINGQYFDNVTFEDLLPHFQFLNIGGEHVGVDSKRNSEELFKPGEGSEYQQKKKQIAIAMETIDGALQEIWPGNTQVDKSSRATLLQVAFGTYSRTEIEGFQPINLQDKARQIVLFCNSWTDWETTQKEATPDIKPRQLIEGLWQKLNSQGVK